MATGTLGQGVNMVVETRFTSLLVKCSKKFSIVETYKRTLSVRTIMTKEKERNFQMTNKCHICNILYAEKGNRVRAHCQVTGKYRGSFHQICNPN